MYVQCMKCLRFYDDVNCWTICPHGPLGFGLSEYCPKCDTLKSVHGPCQHQSNEAPPQLDAIGPGLSEEAAEQLKHINIKECEGGCEAY